MMNVVNMQGRLPDPEKIKHTYTEGDDKKKSFYSGVISVRRDYKDKDEKYYPEDLWNFKAYNGTADFLENYCQGEEVIIQGRLTKGEDYEDKETKETKKGQDYIAVEKAWHSGPAPKKEDGEEGKSEKKADKSKNKTKADAKPAGGGGFPSFNTGASGKKPAWVK